MTQLKSAAIIVILFAISLQLAIFPQPAAAVTVPSASVAESNDFATRVLHDPWDMTQYTDVSQNLNFSGQQFQVQNISVANGVFTAQSTPAQDANFYPLFPGYFKRGPNNTIDKGVQVGKLGVNYPISSAKYRCLYVAANVQTSGTDYFQVFWFADERQNAGGVSGSVAVPTAPGWRVYSINLATAPGGFDTPWTSQSLWRGLRIDPTQKSDVTFSMDWIRLTDCGASTRTIQWTPSGSVDAIWVQPVGTTRSIRVATGVNGNAGTYQLDTQGLAPGQYLVGLGTATSCCSQKSADPLTINQAPIATFAQPSPTSGADYAAQAGNPWDFQDTADARVRADKGTVTASTQNGSLDIVTPSGPLPAGVDVQVKLNTPAPASSSVYRYLTFRMYTEWRAPWQNVPDGMIARWIWSIQDTSGVSGRRCTLVSRDIPYDVGWQTYSIDLADPIQGRAEASAGKCPSPLPNWSSSGSVLDMRFDPNENITVLADPITGGGPFTQKIDWIKLTAENVVAKGTPYAIKLGLNKPASQIVSRTFYYTTDPQQPTQHAAQAFSAPPPSGPNQVYLPFAGRPGAEGEPIANPLDFVWDTSGVAPGTYYVCATLGDGTNSTTVCSDATITVQ
jgi:hypothetical protein